nr:hypothetical protein HUO10_003603 [Paraburkholderia busanensis]
MLGGGETTPARFPLLLEYFAFPDKFNFIDVDLAVIARAIEPARQLTLHVAIKNVPTDSPAARAMELLTESNFKLFCTPVINLFQRDAEPIQLKASVTSYPVVPQALQASAIEVYSIDSVYATEQTTAGKMQIDIPAYRSLSHGSVQGTGSYWLASRDERIALHQPGYETQLSLIGADAKHTPTEFRQIGANITCMNRDTAAAFSPGAVDGDLFNEGASLSCPISLLKRPSDPIRTSRERGALWRLISQMALHTITLGPSGLAALKYLLHQHAGTLSTTSRHIDGIIALDCQPVMRRMPVKPFPAFVRGIEIALTIDETAFIASSVATFSDVMDRVFAAFAHVNSFVELVFISKNTGAELRRCHARQGISPLL